MYKSNKYLSSLQKKFPENRKCIDCENIANFVDIMYGSFVCSRCAGLHRELGSDLSVIKSISLDNIPEDKLKIFEKTRGNSVVNLSYEAINLTDLKKLKPNKDSNTEILREFIRRKYKIRQFYKEHIEQIQKPIKKEQPTQQNTIPVVLAEDMLFFDDNVTKNNVIYQENKIDIQNIDISENREYTNKVNNIMSLFNSR